MSKKGMKNGEAVPQKDRLIPTKRIRNRTHKDFVPGIDKTPAPLHLNRMLRRMAKSEGIPLDIPPHEPVRKKD